MDSKFSFKDLEKVTLKSTCNMKIGNREILPGEILARFDKLQIANLDEIVSTVTANGGFDNRAHVYWTSTKAIRVTFSQGVFSKEQFALMVNAHIVDPARAPKIMITEQEVLESDENGSISLKYVPQEKLFIYDEETGEKITDYERDGKDINIGAAFKTVVVSYEYEYESDKTIFLIGQYLFNGFLELEGRTKIKDDVTGQVTTGIFKIPKLRLVSDLSIRLGAQASPVVGSFRAEGVPVGSRGESYVSEFFILSDDIDSDL